MNSRLNPLGIWVFFLYLVLVATVRPCLAQTTTDVEVEIAGPWSYVVDPSDVQRIVVIAPHSGHSADVFSGQDVSQYETPGDHPLELGLHRLEFTPAPCGAHQSSSAKLLPLTVQDSDVKSAIAAKGSRYAISLPKPCYYESYVEARSIISRTTIVPPTSEARYTTWMILHYKVSGSAPSPATLVERPDVGSQSSSSVDFLSNANSTEKAISIVIYLDERPKRICDQQSADVFDQTQDLLKLQHLNRLFPELDFNMQHPQQTARYNSTCSQTLAESRQVSEEAAAHTAKSKPLVMHKNKGEKAPRTTVCPEFHAPGRADCHAPQINVNGAVN